MQHQNPAHRIVWDEPSFEHESTWQGPPAFDFSEDSNSDAPVSGGAAASEDAHALPDFTPDFGALPEAESYVSAPEEQPSRVSSPAENDDHASGVKTPVNEDDLPEDSLTIGRSRSNGIVLDDMLVSRRHVVITADDEGLLLRDLDSRNGTFVNGRKVEQTHLREGDRIGIGASTFEVRDGWLVAV